MYHGDRVFGIISWWGEINIGLLVGSSATSLTDVRLDREPEFYHELCVEKSVFLSFRRYLIEIESNYKHVIFFRPGILFVAHAALRQG